MTVILSAEHEAELLAAYHANKAKIEKKNAEIAKFLSDEKATCDAAYAKLKKPAYIVTTRVNHVCEQCNAVIPAHTRATIKAVPYVGRVYAEGITSIYLCQKCAPTEKGEGF